MSGYNVYGPETTALLVAASPLNAYKVITTDAQGKAIYADSATLSHGNRVVGISTNAALTGDGVAAQYEGELTNTGWSWAVGSLLFVGLNGEVTTAQTGVFSQAVGYARTPTTIQIRLGRAVFRVN